MSWVQLKATRVSSGKYFVLNFINHCWAKLMLFGPIVFSEENHRRVQLHLRAGMSCFGHRTLTCCFLCRIMCWWFLRRVTAPATWVKNLWTDHMTSSAAVGRTVSSSGQWQEEELCAPLGESPRELIFLSPAVPPPPRRSASVQRRLCRRSSIMVHCRAPAMRLELRATPVSHSVVSVAVGLMWLVETAPCAPRATGVSPTADVSVWSTDMNW